MSTILLVEDDLHQSALYAEELGDCGYGVLTSRDGEQALRYATENHPDLVILDLNLAGMDGLQVLERFLEKCPQLPIIIHSAYDYKERFITYCAEAYVMKSSDLTPLFHAVEAALCQSGSVPAYQSVTSFG